MTASASNSVFSTPEWLNTGNAWLAAYRYETGLHFVTAETGEEIPLPKVAGDGLKGSLDDPRLVESAIRGAVLADKGAAQRVQAALEAVHPKGFFAIISAAIAATGAIVASALAYAKSKNDKKAAEKAAKAAEEARLKAQAEAEKAAAEAAAKMAEERTKQTAMLAGGGVLLLALLVWGLT